MGALRRSMRQPVRHRYVARFDLARYYESINYEILLKILRQRGAFAATTAVVADYLGLPDRHRCVYVSRYERVRRQQRRVAVGSPGASVLVTIIR